MKDLRKDFQKAIKVLNSCNNIEQLKSGHIYYNLFLKKYNYQNTTTAFIWMDGFLYGILQSLITQLSHENARG